MSELNRNTNTNVFNLLILLKYFTVSCNAPLIFARFIVGYSSRCHATYSSSGKTPRHVIKQKSNVVKHNTLPVWMTSKLSEIPARLAENNADVLAGIEEFTWRSRDKVNCMITTTFFISCASSNFNMFISLFSELGLTCLISGVR